MVRCRRDDAGPQHAEKTIARKAKSNIDADVACEKVYWEAIASLPALVPALQSPDSSEHTGSPPEQRTSFDWVQESERVRKPAERAPWIRTFAGQQASWTWGGSVISPKRLSLHQFLFGFQVPDILALCGKASLSERLQWLGLPSLG